MKKHAVTRILALVLVLTLLPCWGGVAFALPDATSPVTVSDTSDYYNSIDVNDQPVAATIDASTDNSSLEVTDYISTTSSNDTTAVEISAGNGKTASVSADTVTASGMASGDATGISGSASTSSSTVNATANSVDAISRSGNASAVTVEDNKGVVNVNAGDVTANAYTPGKHAIGIDVGRGDTADDKYPYDSVNGNQGNVTATADSVTVSGDDALGIDIINDNNGKTTATVQGDVIVNGTDGGTGVSVTNIAGTASGDVTVNGAITVTASEGTGVREDSIDGKESVSVKGPVTVTGIQYAYGAHLDLNSGTETVSFGSSVTAESDKNPFGIWVETYGGTAQVDVAGDINITGQSTGEINYGAGIVVDDHGIGTTNINVDGGITVNEKGYGYGVKATGKGGTETISVKGPVNVTGEEYAYGGNVYVQDGSVNVVFGDDLTVNSGNICSSALTIDAQDGSASVMVDGDVTSSGVGLHTSTLNGDIDIGVTGDVTAGTAGIAVIGNNGTTSFIIDGTIHSSDIGVIVGSGVTEDDLFITVWKIDTTTVDGEDHVVAEVGTIDAAHGLTDDPQITANSKAIEKNIMYIIKVEPSQQSLITLDGVSDNVGRAVAKEGDKVTMKVNVPSGYRLSGAYNGLGEKVPLMKDANGNYYVIVPRGGGVFLSAVLAEASDGVDYSSYVAKTGMATVTFDLNAGHTVTGNPGPIVKVVPVGTWLRLIEAPSKEGAEFELWHTDDETIKVSQPMESFLVQGDVTFTAKWVGEELMNTEEAMKAAVASVTGTTQEEAPTEEAVDAEEDAVVEEVPDTVEEAAEQVVEAAEAVEEPIEPVAVEAVEEVSEPEAQEPEEAVTSPKTGNGPEEAKTADNSADAEETTEAVPADEAVEEETVEDVAAEDTDAKGTEASEEPDDMNVEKAIDEPDDMNIAEVVEDEEIEEPSDMNVEEVTEEADARNAGETNEAVEASPAISLSDLSGSGEGLNLKAKLVIDLGGGQTLELPVNIKVTLG